MKPTIDHSCSYHCDRPECIKAQRDEMRERLKRLDAQEPVAWYRHENGMRVYYESKCWDDLIPLYTKPEANEQPKDSQPVPVEPLLVTLQRQMPTVVVPSIKTMQQAIEYIDTLQSALRRAQEERDKEKEIMTPVENLAYELDGVISDVEKGGCFDGVCLLTIKRVRDALAAGETAPPSDFAAGVSRIPRADGAARNLRQDR